MRLDSLCPGLASLLVAGAAAGQSVSAEVDARSLAGGEHREVGGHNLIKPAYTPSAVTNTSFAFSQGIGMLSFEGMDLLTGAPTDARIFAYSQSFSTSLAIGNRVALDAGVQGLAAVGGDLNTILVEGAFANLNAGGMLKARLFTLEGAGLQVAAGLGGYYQRSLNLSPAAIIGQALQDLGSVEQNIVQQSSAFVAVPAVMVAEGLGPFGVQLGASLPLPVSGDEMSTSLQLAAHAAFDFGDLTSYLPLAVTGEYALTLDFGDADPTHTLVGGLYYSGRRDYELGLNVEANFFPGISVLAGQMVMQYYF
jgi:hypothetical protein